MTLVPRWLASLLGFGTALVVLWRFLQVADEVERVSTTERRATTAAGLGLVGVFVLQWKGVVPPVAPPLMLVGPGLLLTWYPEIRGPVA